MNSLKLPVSPFTSTSQPLVRIHPPISCTILASILYTGAAQAAKLLWSESPRCVAVALRSAEVTSADRFVDVGAGFNQVSLQLALTTGCLGAVSVRFYVPPFTSPFHSRLRLLSPTWLSVTKN